MGKNGEIFTLFGRILKKREKQKRDVPCKRPALPTDGMLRAAKVGGIYYVKSEEMSYGIV